MRLLAKQLATIVKFLIITQSIKDMAVETDIPNILPLCTFKKSCIAKMLAPMRNQLNLKLTASNVRVWTIDTYQRMMMESKHADIC